METTGSDANKAQCSELQTISPRLLNLFAHGFQGRCFQFAAQINSGFVIQFFQQCPRGRNQPGASGQQDHAEQSDHRQALLLRQPPAFAFVNQQMVGAQFFGQRNRLGFVRSTLRA